MLRWHIRRVLSSHGSYFGETQIDYRKLLISSEIDWSGLASCKGLLPLEVGFVYSCYLNHHAREKHTDVTTQIRGAQETV